MHEPVAEWNHKRVAELRWDVFQTEEVDEGMGFAFMRRMPDHGCLWWCRYCRTEESIYSRR